MKRFLVAIIVFALFLIPACQTATEDTEEPGVTAGDGLSRIKREEPVTLDIVLGMTGIESNVEIDLGTTERDVLFVPDDVYYYNWRELIKEEYAIELNVKETYNTEYYYDGSYIRSMMAMYGFEGLAYFPSTAQNLIYPMMASGEILPMKAILDESPIWRDLPENLKGMYAFEGDIWALPDSLSPSVYARSYNSDWLDAINRGVPETLDELYETCAKFTGMDPDGNNLDDTFGIYAAPLHTIDIFNVYDCRIQPSNNNTQYVSIAFYPEKDIFEDFMFSDKAEKAFEYVTGLVEQGYATLGGDEMYGSRGEFIDKGEFMENRRFSFSLEGKATNPVFYNYEGGFYLLDDKTEEGDVKLRRFVETFYGDEEAYLECAMGIDPAGATFNNNSMAGADMPALLGRLPMFYKDEYDSVADKLGTEAEMERLENAKAIEEFIRSGNHYTLYPRTGFGVWERHPRLEFSSDGSGNYGLGDPLMALFETIYHSIAGGHLPVKEGIGRYRTEALAMGIEDYIVELNDKIGK